MCGRNARIAMSGPVAIELWNMAKEYQRKAARLGALPDIGEPPPTGPISWSRYGPRSLAALELLQCRA